MTQNEPTPRRKSTSLLIWLGAAVLLLEVPAVIVTAYFEQPGDPIGESQAQVDALVAQRDTASHYFMAVTLTLLVVGGGLLFLGLRRRRHEQVR